MITSSTERLASKPVKTTAAQNEHNGGLEISFPGAAPGSANKNPPESIGFSRGQQSLDHSVWYNGALMTFLATSEDTHGQFALIEAVGRRGNVPPPHVHTGKIRSSTYWRARSSFRSAVTQSRARPAP